MIFSSKRRIAIAMLFGQLVMLVVWQNCSNVRLLPPPVQQFSVAGLPPIGAKTAVCPKLQPLAPATTYYLFVIDMSVSNVGEWVSQGPYTYFDSKTNPTDAGGKRFDAVQYFLQNCGNQSGAQFAVIGFSDQAGQVSGSGSSATYDCSHISFAGADVAAAELQTLKQAQLDEAPWYYQWTQSSGNYLSNPNFPPLMGGTNYTAALSCARQTIFNDLLSTSGTSAENYRVIFISDGSPQDKKGQGCALTTMSASESQACYMSNIDTQVSAMREGAIAETRNLLVYGIYYGNAEGSAAPTAMQQLAMDGGTPAPMALASFQSNSLCAFAANSLSEVMTPDSLFAINLTSIKRGDQILADSDMDGLSDDDETGLGYDPLNPRTVSGVLDGVCAKVAGKRTDCQNLRNQMTCNPDIITSSFLTDCDIKMLNLAAPPAGTNAGVDSDLDGLPDFVEIVKHLNPTFADALADPDGDGIANILELRQGTDPFTADSNFPDASKNDIKINFNSTSQACGQNGAWEIEVDHVQVSPIQTINNLTSTLSPLNHLANEQVLFLGYRLTPTATNNGPMEYYGQIIKVQTSDQGDQTVTTPPTNSFSLLGKVLK